MSSPAVAACATWRTESASAARNDSWSERPAIVRDIRRPALPHAIRISILEAVLQCVSQRPQAKRIAERVRVYRDVAYERMLLALLDHLLELIDDHLAEFARAVLPMDD